MYNTKSLQKLAQVPIIKISAIVTDDTISNMVVGQYEENDVLKWGLPTLSLLSGETYSAAAERVVKKHMGLLPILDVTPYCEFQQIGYDIKIVYTVIMKLKGKSFDLSKLTPEYNWKWIDIEKPSNGQYTDITALTINLLKGNTIDNKNWKIYKITEL